MSFINHFIREVFSSARKIVLQHSHPAAIEAFRRPSTTATTSSLIPALSDDTTQKTVYDKLNTNSTRVARQVIVPPHTAKQVLVTRIASRLLAIQPYFQCLFHHTTIAARRIVKLSPRRSFYITTSSFSDVPQHLQKRIVIAHTELLSLAIYHCRQTRSNHDTVETSEAHKLKTSSTKTKTSDFAIPLEPLTTKLPLKGPRKWSDTSTCETRTSNASYINDVKNSA